MKLTIVGCAGSFPSAESPASCYLIEAPYEGGTYRLVLDLGNGALGALQRYVDLRAVDAIALSHLHADHCFDMSGFYVVSKYHPEGALARIPVLAPIGTSDRLAKASGIEEPEGMTEQFEFRDHVDGRAVQLGPFTITPRLVDHPVTAFALRVATETHVIAYSGDTGPTDALVEVAEGADIFLCEASFLESCDNPPSLHLTGAEAGDHATRAGVRRLLITHIPAWTDASEVEADTKSTWDGPCELVSPGSVYTL